MTKQDEIALLKQDKHAIILAHYYVSEEIQAIADYVGDSYYLSKIVTTLPEQILVFCGVSFMGESAKLLNPNKTVLMPDPTADCPMAHMVTKETIDNARETYDDLSVVCYINSTDQIKSWSDVCVTSANAVKIIKNLPSKNILFIPDKNLAHFVAAKVPEKHFIFNEGFCPIHEYMSAEEISYLKTKHPEAKVLVHPECNEAILSLADYIGSTSGIIEYAKNSSSQAFIIGTVVGVRYQLEQVRKDATFYFPKTTPLCPDMSKITLDQIIHVLKTGENAVHMPPSALALPAQRALANMLDLAK